MSTTQNNVLVTDAELETLRATPAPKLPRAVKVSPERAAQLKAERLAARTTDDALTFLVNRFVR